MRLHSYDCRCVEKKKKKQEKNVTNNPGNSFFSTLILLPVKCGAGVWPNDATGPYALSAVVVLRANLKPEALLSALLPTNNEIKRFLRGREHDQTGALSTSEIENIPFKERGEDPPRTSCKFA